MICTGQGISKMLGGNSLFENLSFEIMEKDRVGIVGRNGSGKTTLLQLLAGIETVDDGVIHYKKGTNVGYLAQIASDAELVVKEVLRKAFTQLITMQERMNELESEMARGDESERTLKEYGHLLDAFTRKGGYEIESSIQHVANGLGIQSLLATSFQQLSGGEKTKVGLGLLLLQEPDLLLLDEPTNHLDVEAVEWLEGFMKQYKGTVIIVSHDRYFLDEVATKIMDLEDGELHVYKGTYSDFVEQKEKVLLAEFAAYQEQQKKMKKMREAIKRLKEWANQANPPNAALHKRARNMERALERMDKIKRPILERRKMGLAFDLNSRSGKDVVRFEGVSIGFEDVMLVEKINCHIRYGERVAIVGKNGSGKTTLIKTLLGTIPPQEGKMNMSGSVKVGYLSQHVLSGDERVIDVYRETAKVSESDARHELARFMFYGYTVFSKVSSLSGGEKMRLRLAQLMSQKLNLLVLDEPTNHLDIDSREVLEDALDKFTGTIICVSHDRYFLNKCFPITYWIENKALHHYLYSYSEAKLKHLVADERDPIEKKEATTVVKEITAEEEVEQLEMRLFEIDQSLDVINCEKEYDSLSAEKEKLSMKREKLYEVLMGEET
ncbi:ribosomal protection-like ABC-F family protein [Bacillus sp. RAR_GA_16]|uniref:ribosomal protection-like ABC-F family protein n=1 Tax=Bacillus sp. RAR_GA_16 TaxID=2876774 RepID=UPI0029624936|nr:ABC-F family ATP-binding cassette domain-containing protein [Bacillus sp. RAR_GA_16]